MDNPNSTTSISFGRVVYDVVYLSRKLGSGLVVPSLWYGLLLIVDDACVVDDADNVDDVDARREDLVLCDVYCNASTDVGVGELLLSGIIFDNSACKFLSSFIRTDS